MKNVKISKKYSFIEYTGYNVPISNLTNEALDNLSKVIGISEDNDHLVEFSPNGKFNTLTDFETNKKYLIIGNIDNPNFTLYSYLETIPPTMILSLSLTGTWDAGGSGASEETAYTKNSWTTTEQLKVTALVSGTIHVSWTSVSAYGDPNYGEASIWKNTGPDVGSPVVELQIGSSGSGSYSTHLDQGQYLTLLRRDAAYWDGIKVWLTT